MRKEKKQSGKPIGNYIKIDIKNLKLAQEDINAALEAVEDIEKVINDESVEKDVLKEKFVALSEKVQQLENLLKTEGIL